MTQELRSIEISIPDDNPFENCKLNRKVYAENLTQIILNYPKGFVLAIDNEWGGGKTTFVKMWEQLLKIKNIKTVFFNAWENDLNQDGSSPLFYLPFPSHIRSKSNYLFFL
ncbi:MAG: P-loop NTPase fold protein [Leadbetterella sp.]